MKALFAGFGLILVPTLAAAQALQPPAPQQQFSITLPFSAWQKVGDGLGELKIKDGGEVLQAINQQIAAQMKTMAEKLEADKKAAVPAPSPNPDPKAKPK